ncbi:hypothetical protein HKD37_03G008064 [Glycine soja]|nr:hypothetical protein GmHk_03G008097 [Glycine max]
MHALPKKMQPHKNPPPLDSEPQLPQIKILLRRATLPNRNSLEVVSCFLVSLGTTEDSAKPTSGLQYQRSAHKKFGFSFFWILVVVVHLDFGLDV